ncbi:MAG: tRNA pseudouridine synthase A [Candidatus Omnitrophica bacterium ADurb.Bin277]|nr:MAG: tRNA pseudouridine synthase A [Candidatus Omnitrophica bacterium ADurb.Bin277]
MIRNIKLVLEYDGASFFGFQRQPGKPTIQEALEKALSGFFDRKMKIASASGRTDTGVHAEGQVVHFKTDSGRSLYQIQKGLNAHLPPSIAVKSVEEVPEDFHARYSARSKIYEYRVWNHPCRSPLLAGRVHHIAYPLDSAAMRRAAKYLVGRHDFRSFTSESAVRKGRKRKDVSFVRIIKKLRIDKKGDLLVFRFEADGFLYHMVRNMVGTLLEVGRGKREPSDMKAILDSRARRFSGVTAPPAGLTLHRVDYTS